jgi:hypothetical protein
MVAAVRFEIDQRFPARPTDVVRAYTEPALYERMVGMTRIDRPEVLSTETRGDLVVVRVRYRFVADVPSAARALIDPGRLTWIDESDYDIAALTSSTQLAPDHYPDRLTGSATSRFAPDPADPAHTLRHITAEVTVRAPLVGGRVERAIVDGLREHLADEAAVVARHLGAAAG